jgi:hypothetical protein
MDHLFPKDAISKFPKIILPKKSSTSHIADSKFLHTEIISPLLRSCVLRKSFYGLLTLYGETHYFIYSGGDPLFSKKQPKPYEAQPIFLEFDSPI